MSSPVYLKPPPSPFDQLGEQKDEQHLQLYLPSHLAASSLSSPTFFNTTDQDQRMIKIEEAKQHDHQQKVDQCTAYGASSDLPHEPLPNSVDDITKLCKREVIGDEGSTSCDSGSSSAKWMSSKMRLMQKMMNSTCTGTDESVKITQKLKFHRLHDTNEVINSFNSSNSTIRVCSDCNTTTTPLWRSGPRGPKSLCNACGIRQRKARRAMEAAAVNGTSAATDALATKFKVHNKEKKSRTSHVTQYKKQCNKPPDHPTHHIQSQSERKICFEDFAIRWSKNSSLKQVFPQDVEEAAILLMELSCGYIQS